MTRVQLPINQNRYRHEIENNGRGNESIAQPHPRKTLRASVIFRHGLEHDAPPEIAVDLNVPFIPARIGGIAPSFLLQQLEDLPEKMMAILAFFAPVGSPQPAARRTGCLRQMFMGSNDTARRPLEM